MNKYNLIVLAGHTHWDVSVFATSIHRGQSGCYTFYDEKEIVACYPIERTIVASIEKLDEKE